MRQRVALIRTLLLDPDILLLDEPFSALDYQTRLYLEGILMEAVETFHKTVILVTHDIDEAVALSKRVVVLSQRPARVKAVHDIALNEHSPIAARSDPRFSGCFHTLCAGLDIQARKSALTETAQVAKTAAPARPRQKKRRNVFDSLIGRSALQILAVVGFFLLWEAAVRWGWLSGFLVGQPSGVLRNLIGSIANGSLFADTGYTIFEAILGFAFGTVIGSVIGLALWYSVFVARLVEPFIAAINSVPKIALAPIIILWFGTGLLSKVALAISLTSIVALITAYRAAKGRGQRSPGTAFLYGRVKQHIFKRVIAPSTLPAIVATFRINIGFALVGAVVGEFISSQHGLGHVICVASSLYDLNTVWAGLFTLMLVGFLFYPWSRSPSAGCLPGSSSRSGTQINV